MTAKTCAETARETLMQISSRKLSPTPDNYRAIYNEIAGIPGTTDFPTQALQAAAEALPAHTAFQKQQRAAFEHAIAQASWEELQCVLVDYASRDDSDTRLDDTDTAVDALLTDPAEPRSGLMVALCEQVARLVENSLPALGEDDSRFSRLASEVIEHLRDPEVDHVQLGTRLTEFCRRLSFVAEDQAEIRTTLLRLLHVVTRNMGEISMDDGWLKRQLEALTAAAVPPLSLKHLDEFERRFADVMGKQMDAKERSLQAQDEVRRMLATFVERLVQMTDSTSTYHYTMERSAQQLEQAKNIEEVTPVLHDIIGATRSIALEMKSTRDELRTMREKVQASQAEITRLHEELHVAASQARHDTLTGALNRKGLDEVLQRELAEVRRKETPLCVALLDLDNFKKLNDSKGHEIGDTALQHLVKVTKECMRGQDTLARSGGEEFVIIMPDTGLESGIEAMVRLQRALTRRYFLAGNEQILITFSAGVAQVERDEDAESAIRRADQAMYLAKRAGRNRVLGA